ncbi:MAG: outer membrane beta-barrel protein [Acidobacteriia bacterium]|nr:outer membrane beta-barrel protein [Terriglobia bacterium]
MRKFALPTTLASWLLLLTFAHAQQADVTFGAGTLLSSSTTSASVTAVGAEKGGTYLNFGGDVIFRHRIGFNVEAAWRAKQGLDVFGQPYRPILVDFNGVFQPRITKKAGADLMAGIGFQSTRFYGFTPTSSCVNFGACYTSDNHFLVHVGGGVRYYVWGHVFFRPEAHYYRISNNFQFHSGNIVRVGASIGYTIGPE